MAIPSRARPFICNICGQEMPFREISNHQRLLHPAELQAMQQANQDFGRRLLVIVGPATLFMFVALFTPFMIFGVHAPGWYIVVVFLGWIASMPMGWRYARRKTQVEFEVLGNMLYRCRICEVPIPRKDMHTHLATEHPRELKYLRISAYVVFGSLFGILSIVLVFFSAYFLDLLPSVPVDTLRIWVYGALFAWMGFIVLWGVLVDPRLKAKAQAAWRTTHFADQAYRR